MGKFSCFYQKRSKEHAWNVKYRNITVKYITFDSSINFTYNSTLHPVDNSLLYIKPNTWYHQCTAFNTETGRK